MTTEQNIIDNSRILKILHDNPNDDDDLIVKRVALRKQLDELQSQPIAWVTCPCGRRLALRMAYRCRFCGLILCSQCADIHFKKGE